MLELDENARRVVTRWLTTLAPFSVSLTNPTRSIWLRNCVLSEKYMLLSACWSGVLRRNPNDPRMRCGKAIRRLGPDIVRVGSDAIGPIGGGGPVPGPSGCWRDT